LHPQDPDRSVEDIISALKDQVLSHEKIDTAISRINTVKKRLKGINEHEIDYAKHQILAGQIADMSITQVKRKSGIFPIAVGKNIPVNLTILTR